MDFSNKVVLVAGGTRGIGLTVAKALIDKGAICYITGRKIEGGLLAREYLGDNCIYIQNDATDENSVRELSTKIEKDHGSLNFAVNCVGATGNHQPIRDFKFDDWRQIFDSNLIGPLLLLREEIKLIEGNVNGAIVNVSSCGGILGTENQSAYSSSKAALNMLTQVCALECSIPKENGRNTIRINAVCPGPTLGGMNSKERLEANPESTKRKMQITALKRFADPQEIASTILFLLSEDSSYMTGSVLPVDGGFSAGKF
ncbi:SDR family NAD(P)-dependent oxidoreductase [Oceanospirillum maris]|uniref:SDR family NAD(P)-dependent oxidoreductase n=1 Tax=Oceanospirillum maris TaxID=64977 RepID=UPI0004266C78|nr:SDR family oxidoreductase [Oceanospirillum maris]